jgi:hypothetical protein
MQGNEEQAATLRAIVHRSGRERRRQFLPFPQSEELRRRPDRRQAAGEAPEPFWQSAQTSLLRFLGRH